MGLVRPDEFSVVRRSFERDAALARNPLNGFLNPDTQSKLGDSMNIAKLLLSIALTGFTLPVLAAEEAPPTAAGHGMSQMTMKPTKDEREQMANVHADMAACLRSEKEFTICREELHAQCQSMMGGSCQGMDMMGGNHKALRRKK
jgi:hypothetical protein